MMAPDDKILFVQTLSKNWAMTGWRIGWLEAPPALGAGDREPHPVHDLGRAGASTQRAATAALEEGETFLAEQVARMHAARDIVAEGSAATGRVSFAVPEAAFYLFCADRRRTRLARAGAAPDRRGRRRRRARLRLRAGRRGLSAPVLRARARRNRRGDRAGWRVG